MLRVDDYNLAEFRGRSKVSKTAQAATRIFRIICKRDKVKFQYLMGWLAWTVQRSTSSRRGRGRPNEQHRGSGKSTLGKVMLIFVHLRPESHGLLVDDKEQLLGKFNSHLETACFVSAVLWAGDPRAADTQVASPPARSPSRGEVSAAPPKCRTVCMSCSRLITRGRSRPACRLKRFFIVKRWPMKGLKMERGSTRYIEISRRAALASFYTCCRR